MDAMVNNKQVNFWRGDQTPPTIYHIWIKDNSKMLLYNGLKWVVFLDSKEVIDAIEQFQEQLDRIEQNITTLGNKTVNKKYIKDNPVLNGDDIYYTKNGQYINNSNTLSQSLNILDKLLTTQIFE